MKKLGLALAFLLISSGLSKAQDAGATAHEMASSEMIEVTLRENTLFPNHTMMFYVGEIMYYVSLGYGLRGLEIDVYKTNVQFASLKQPQDSIELMLVMGEPRIYKISRYVDKNTDDMVDDYIVNTQVPPYNDGFTRDELDRSYFEQTRGNILWISGNRNEYMEDKKITKPVPSDFLAETDRGYAEALKAVLNYIKSNNS